MKIIGGNAAGNMIHKTGGIEHLQKINPQAGPAPEIPCPPAAGSCTATGAPSGALGLIGGQGAGGQGISGAGPACGLIFCRCSMPPVLWIMLPAALPPMIFIKLSTTILHSSLCAG